MSSEFKATAGAGGVNPSPHVPPETAAHSEIAHDAFAKYGDLMTTANICEATGFCERHVRAMCRSGELPAVKIGRRYFVPKVRMMERCGIA